MNTALDNLSEVTLDANTPQNVGELVEIIRAFNEVTDRLQASHETLNAEVGRLQQELASANTALQRSKRLAALGEMAAGIAHEIRNPLASIQLYAKMLTEDLGDRPEQASIASQIAQAVRGLDGIVTDVLAFSREVRLQPDEISALDLFDRAIEALKPMVDQFGTEVAMVGEDRLITVDRETMHRAVVNLIRNAIEAAGEGGRLTLGVAGEGEQAVLTIRDTGPGIADDQIDRIFNPFYTTRATGTGLGLAIVHRIVDAHGGTIAVHNDDGAVFTLSLPPLDAGAILPERYV